MLFAYESYHNLSHDEAHQTTMKSKFRIVFLLCVMVAGTIGGLPREFNDCHIITTL